LKHFVSNSMSFLESARDIIHFKFQLVLWEYLDHNVKTESSGFGYQGRDLESRLDPKTALGTLTKNSLGGKHLVGTKMTNLGIHWNDLI
jgi:hypothetical protein